MRYLLIILILLVTRGTNAQNKQGGWMTVPPSIMGFSENLGRYEAVLDEEVLFYAETYSYRIYFSDDAFVFAKAQEFSDEELHERHEKMEHNEPLEPVEWYYFKVEFSNANSGVELSPDKIKTYTRNFQNPTNLEQTLKARTYDQLTIENIYPNIDVVFELPEEGGLKYSFLVHPGGDPDLIKMNYDNTEVEKDDNGDLKLSNTAGDFIDHAPISFVEGAIIESAFVQEGSAVQFTVADYDRSKELIIDPWITTVLFDGGSIREVYEISYDNSNNCVVVLEGEFPLFTEVISYYNSAGVLLWESGVLNFGDVSMNPVTGDVYVLQGMSPLLKKFNPFGTFISGISISGLGITQEAWRLKYNEVLDEVVVGDGGLDGGDSQITIVPSDLGSYVEYEILDDPAGAMEDVALLEVDPDDGSYYFLPSGYIGGASGLYGNTLYHINALDPTDILWETATPLTYQEVSNTDYSGRNGVNGITCGENYVYIYDGNSVVQYDKITGDELLSATVGEDIYSNYGIDLDPCGNVYVGTSDHIQIFNDALEEIGTVDMPNEAYDLEIGNGHLFVCGLGFIKVLELADVGVDLGFDVVPATCDACDGSATYNPDPCVLMIFEGVEWLADGSTEFLQEDLCPGWHFLTTFWTDLDGLPVIQMDSVEVTSIDTEIIVAADITNLLCNGDCNGGLAFTASEGTATYTFILDGVTNETGIYTDLCAGIYEVEVTDVNGCDGVLEVLLVEPAELILEIIEESNVTCAGFSDGLINVDATGGTEPYLFDIGGTPVGFGTFTGLAPGDYTMTVVDANGCTASIPFSISEPATLILDATMIAHVLCNGENSGNLEVTATGGFGAYVFSKDGVTFGAESLFTDLGADEYTITVRDENGCEFDLSITINEPTVLDVLELLTHEICEEDCNGEIDITISGGIAPYSSSIDDCLTMETFSIFTDLCPADYAICVEDANGCRFNNVVTVNPGIVSVDPIMVAIGPFCADAAPVAIEATDLGDLTGPGIVGGTFDPALAGPGIHTITNTIVNECGGGIGTLEVIVNPLPNVALLANETSACIPFKVFFENTGETGVSCVWNFGDGTIVETCDFIMHEYTIPGVYDVSLIVVDANGCSATTTYVDYIEAYEIPIANFKYAPLEVTTLDLTVDFTDLSTGADSWIWTFDVIGTSSDQNPSFLFPDEEGSYEIIQIVINQEGCRDTMVQTIVVIQEHLIFVPNIITPDENTLNEIFLPYFTGIDVYNYQLAIFNRWGELIFESYDVNTGWNGTYNNAVVQDGVYIWHIVVVDKDTDMIREYHGHVSVLR